MIPADGPPQAGLFVRTIRAAAESDRVGHRMRQCQHRRNTREARRHHQEPPGVAPVRRLEYQRAHQDHHDERDQTAHRSRRRGRAMVVARDGGKHGLGEIDGRRSVPEKLGMSKIRSIHKTANRNPLQAVSKGAMTLIQLWFARGVAGCTPQGNKRRSEERV